MNKEDIIRLSKNNSNNEYEQESLYRGSAFALAIIVLVGVFLNAIAYFTEKSGDIGICAMMFTGLACEALIEGKKSRRKGLMIFGIVSAVMSVIFIIGYIGKRVGLS